MGRFIQYKIIGVSIRPYRIEGSGHVRDTSRELMVISDVDDGHGYDDDDSDDAR